MFKIRITANNGIKVRRHDIYPRLVMSHAFVKEGDEQWLHDLPPTMNALINYLTRENNGVRVYEKRSYIDPKRNKEVYEMSNGLSYTIDDEGKWSILW